jgi:hypothetical protein
MDKASFQFLSAVLGDDGASALQKAAERSSELSSVLVPRAILAWLNTAGRYDFEGEVPGIENSYISFSKSSKGFDGSVDMYGERYEFEGASMFHLAASVATVVGIDHELGVGVRDSDIERLGKSIDLLARTRLLSSELAKSKIECIGAEQCKTEGCKHGEPLEKGKPGQMAAPIAPTAPMAPTATAPKPVAPVKAKLPKLPGSAQLPKTKLPATTSIAMTKAEASAECFVCGVAQFDHGHFDGCFCFRELAKSAKATESDDGYVLEVNGWGKDDITTLLEAVGRM